MYRLVILSFVVFAVLAQDLDKKPCGRSGHPGHCCKQGNETVNKLVTAGYYDVKECLLIPMDPIKCERLICIGKKKGYATDDGKIESKDKIIEALSKDHESPTDLLEDLKSKCVNGDLEMYGKPEFCDLAKLRNCISVQILNHCADWIDSEHCKEKKEIVEECVKLTS